MKTNRYIILSMALFLLAPMTACTNRTEDLSITDAWVAEAPPGSKVMVGYMTLANSTDQAMTVKKAHSENFSSIEFHETVHENNMAHMMRYETLDIPANDKLVLERGGRHLMLFNPASTLKAGDRITITLTREDGSEMATSFEVRKSEFQ